MNICDFSIGDQFRLAKDIDTYPQDVHFHYARGTKVNLVALMDEEDDAVPVLIFETMPDRFTMPIKIEDLMPVNEWTGDEPTEGGIVEPVRKPRIIPKYHPPVVAGPKDSSDIPF